MKKIVFIMLCSLAFYACNNSNYLNNKEKEHINNGDASQSMRILSITNHQDSLFLRQKSKDVDIEVDKDNLEKLVKRMQVTMENEGGVGIAAVQVGIQRNIILITRFDKQIEQGESPYSESDPFSEEENIKGYINPVDVFINPKMLSHSYETIIFEGDGCLSIPGYWGNTSRYNCIEVEYYNLKGELIKETIHGSLRPDNFTAVIFQHEFDHLQGTLFLDRIYKNQLFYYEDLE